MCLCMGETDSPNNQWKDLKGLKLAKIQTQWKKLLGQRHGELSTWSSPTMNSTESQEQNNDKQNK